MAEIQVGRLTFTLNDGSKRTCGIHGDDTTSGRCASCDTGHQRIAAKRLVAGDRLVKALGYPEATLSGDVLDVRPSPGGGCVLVTFDGGELMLYPTDMVEVAR